MESSSFSIIASEEELYEFRLSLLRMEIEKNDISFSLQFSKIRLKKADALRLVAAYSKNIILSPYQKDYNLDVYSAEVTAIDMQEIYVAWIDNLHDNALPYYELLVKDIEWLKKPLISMPLLRRLFESLKNNFVITYLEGTGQECTYTFLMYDKILSRQNFYETISPVAARELLQLLAECQGGLDALTATEISSMHPFCLYHKIDDAALRDIFRIPFLEVGGEIDQIEKEICPHHLSYLDLELIL